MSDIEKSQIAIMDECASNCCNHQCNEGRDCPNKGIDAGMYAVAALVVFCTLVMAAIVMRWLVS